MTDRQSAGTLSSPQQSGSKTGASIGPRPGGGPIPGRGPGRGPMGSFASFQKPKNVSETLGRLLSTLKPYTGSLILVFFFVLIYILLDLVGPYMIGVAIDDYITGRDISGLLRTALLMAGAFLGSWIFQSVSGVMMADVSQKFLRDLRRRLFEHLQTLSLRFFDRNPHGELMSRLTNDIDAINQAISQNITQLFASLLSLVGILVMMFILNIPLAITTILLVPILMLVTGFIAGKTRQGYRDLQFSLGRMNGTMEESISGLRVIKAFGRNHSVIDNFTRENDAVYQTGVLAKTYSALLMPLTAIMGNLIIVSLAAVGGWLALQGLVTVGVIATFIGYGRRFTQPLRQIASLYNTLQSALAGAERIFEILDEAPVVTDIQGAPELVKIQGDVQFSAVNFAYIADVPVLKDINLHARPGETIALVGPTGAGKTTIVNLLTRFYDIDSGSIRIDGQDIRRVQIDSLRRQLGIVLQDTYLFSESVMENIRYGNLTASDEEVIKAASLANADHFIRSLPDGYQTELSERAGNLSQGQRQLLAIARAVLADPAILILDEATSSVDTRTEIQIQRALLKLMKGRTSFVIAHRLSTIREANQVLVIDHGEIIESGTHEDLLAQRGYYYNLYQSQFRKKAA
ncbi:MAG: ABC transporter ATP-binding protein [Anaerolineales bacterium]|nr:ABC transporter ATP-binding protein [Anaerolineales bacterium]